MFGIEEFPIVLLKTFGFVLTKCRGENLEIYLLLHSCPIQSNALQNKNTSCAAKRKNGDLNFSTNPVTRLVVVHGSCWLPIRRARTGRTIEFHCRNKFGRIKSNKQHCHFKNHILQFDLLRELKKQERSRPKGVYFAI